MADTSFVALLQTTANRIGAVWLNQINKWAFWGRRPNYATTTGSANAQILTLETGSLYSIGGEADGDEFTFRAGFTCSGAMTLQIIPPGGTNTARAVQLNQQALVGGEVLAGSLYKAQRLGTTWQLFNLQQLVDGQPVVVGSADPTKKLRFSVAGLTTATTRIITWADQNLTFAALTAIGDSWWASAAGTLARLAVGTNGQLLSPDSTQTAGVRWIDPGFRGMLAGCQLTWVSGTSYTMGVGTCRDDADTENMKVASALTMSNLTVGWIVGNNQPKIRTGVTLSNGMTLHAYVIKRVDTLVVDWFLTDEASAPTLPTGYTKSRRVASRVFTVGAQTFPQVLQDGDLQQVAVPVLETTAANPGTAAVTLTLVNVPTGVNMRALLIMSSSGGFAGYLSDLTTTDVLPAGTTAPLGQVQGAGGGQQGWQGPVRTNTSAQIRTRISASGGGQQLFVATAGWYDRRGQDA